MNRVALTTAVDRWQPLAATARGHGLDPVPLPCIEVIPRDDAAIERARGLAAHADWLLVTSPRAIPIVWPQGGMPPAPVAAVGEATAASVERAGGRVVLIGDSGAASLAGELALQAAGKTVFFPHAAGAGGSASMTLEKGGAEVTAVAVYETRPIPPGPDPVDAVIFGSPSAVRGWRLSRSLDGLVLAVIGVVTAAALADAGERPHVLPPRPDFDDLVARLADHLTNRSPV